MAGGLHVVERESDLALFVDHESRAQHAFILAAIHRLRAVSAIEHVHGLVFVAQQLEVELLVDLELLELLDRVRRYAEHGVARLLQRVEVVVEVASLFGAARSRGGRVEVENYFLAFELA